MIHDELLDLAKKSPRLPLFLHELKDYLKEEQQKRQDFYDFVTEDMKAEFINGEVVVHSPVSDEHESASSELHTLLNIHVSFHDIGRVTHEKLMIRLTRNDYEPDICFFKKEKARRFKEGQKLFPAPDFVVEIISKSTEKTDRTIKFEDYAEHGIEEYWIIDPRKKSIEKYLLEQNKYELAEKLTQGMVESKIVRGFNIPVRAIFYKTEFKKTLAKFLSAK
jgi:Uma2 family endonuclease